MAPTETPPGPAGALRFAEGHSIGRASLVLKRRHVLGRIWRMMLGMAAVILGAMALGIARGGIDLPFFVLTALSALLVAALLLRYPRLVVPRREQLGQGSLPEMIGRTELWLESRSAGLPDPARQTIEQIGIQLDALALELERADDPPADAAEIRQLLGQRLPGLFDRADSAAEPLQEAALIDGLRQVGARLAFITRHLGGGYIRRTPLAR